MISDQTSYIKDYVFAQSNRHSYLSSLSNQRLFDGLS